MPVAEIREAGAADLALLADALERLSADLGDRHRTGTGDLAAACLGADPACHGIIAVAAGAAAGAALISPVFSTTRGAAGVYVSDLWVAPESRGAGLGKRLLHEAAVLGARLWRARFLKLTVYATNQEARGFYDRIGFDHAEMDHTMLLEGTALDALTGDET